MHAVWWLGSGISAGSGKARAQSGVRLPSAEGFQALAFLCCSVAHPTLQLRLDLGRFGGFYLPQALRSIIAALILAQCGARHRQYDPLPCSLNYHSIASHPGSEGTPYAFQKAGGINSYPATTMNISSAEFGPFLNS